MFKKNKGKSKFDIFITNLLKFAIYKKNSLV